MARVRELATRFKVNHDAFVAEQQQLAEGGDGDGGNGGDEGEESEYDIEQLLCSEDGFFLVSWAGFDLPTWEPAAAIPDAAQTAYRRQGPVELREYMAVLDAC